MTAMFNKTNSFNQDISGWDVLNVVSMERMFKENNSFNQDLSSWNVLNVLYCSGFSYRTNGIWLLPKPSFTNCGP